MKSHVPGARAEGNSESKESPGEASRPILVPLVLILGLTLAAQLVSLAFGRSNPEQGFASMVLPSVVFLSIITLPLAAVGIALGRQIGLGAPLLEALLSRKAGSIQDLWRHAALAAVLGLALGAVLLLVRIFSQPYLPPQFPAFGHRGIVGGLSVSIGAAVAEEVWFRLGLMTLLVWCAARLVGHKEVRPVTALPVIVITALGFGLAHLPQLMSYGAGSPFAIGGTIAGNCLVGLLYGWLYWRRSLIAAIFAHFSLDLVLHVFPAFTT